MIVIEEDSSGVKLPHPELQRGTAEDTSEGSQLLPGPPPAYSTSSSYGAPYNAPFQYPQDVPVHPRNRVVHGEAACRRFSKAFIVAVGVWFLMAILIQGVVEINNGPGDKGSGGKITPPGNTDGKKNPRRDGRIRDPVCVIGVPGGSSTPSDPSSDTLNSVKLEFSLPVASDFAFFSNDSYAYGSFVVESFESSGSDVDIDVVISYRSKKALRRSKVCLFEKGVERTIGVMRSDGATDPPSSATLLRYDIYVRLPVPNPKKRPLYVSSLVADLALFAIGIVDLAGRAEFGVINLKTMYAVIEAESLVAHEARLETAQANIQGNFTVSSSLKLVTKNAPIQADITMHSTGSSDHPPTVLVIQTENAAISGRLSLSDFSSSLSNAISSWTTALNGDSVGGYFSILGSTSNARISLSILDQPPSSIVSLSAQTSSATAEVFLPPEFTGAFKIATTVSRPALDISKSDPPDSSHGKGRRREVEMMREENNILEGKVTWVDRRGRVERGRGIVDVRTSLLPVILRL